MSRPAIPDPFAHDRPWLILGLGHMAGALVTGWAKAGCLPVRLFAVGRNAEKTAQIARLPGVSVVPTIEQLPADLAPGLCLLAVKPQGMEAALTAARSWTGRAAHLVTIAAGLPYAWYETHGIAPARLTRAMPNMAVAVGRGVTLLAGARAATPTEAAVEALFATLGLAPWVEEDRFDAATALSGCGPAYLFRLTQAMAAAGAQLGLAPDLALDLARATMEGAALQMAAQSDRSPGQLLAAVTSKGGMTLAALDRMDALEPMMQAAIAAAATRGEELARLLAAPAA